MAFLDRKGRMPQPKLLNYSHVQQSPTDSSNHTNFGSVAYKYWHYSLQNRPSSSSLLLLYLIQMLIMIVIVVRSNILVVLDPKGSEAVILASPISCSHPVLLAIVKLFAIHLTPSAS
ncbi:hypothetical protein PGT21_012344 [Puccinia graminis f. sp. tritici]|uniref:Uncharacterized protein n=1 Tax=Puccinia graminis f. sp. tritici TaxID=56615 RepID=A0A5B0MD57_PUCGR|nr:hypothetical protein PGT21_012344 [Puccinia graminis f. sp. tritici]